MRPRQMEESKMVSFRMDMKIMRQLDKIGEELDRSVSWLVRKAAEEYIERHKRGKQS